MELLWTNMLSETDRTCPSTLTVVETTTWGEAKGLGQGGRVSGVHESNDIKEETFGWGGWENRRKGRKGARKGSERVESEEKKTPRRN